MVVRVYVCRCVQDAGFDACRVLMVGVLRGPGVHGVNGFTGETKERRRTAKNPLPPSPPLPLVRGREGQRHAIDAITQAGWRRTVGKHMTEMAAALAAMHFGSAHAEAAVNGLADRARERRKEAGPAGATLELSIRDE